MSDRLLDLLRSDADTFDAAAPTPAPAPAFGRLAAMLARPEERLAPFAERLGSMIDVGTDVARSYLARIFDPDSWEGLMPGIDVVHLQGGAATAGSDVGFVRIEAGGAFPEHAHLGDEHALILSGRLIDSIGGEAGPGDTASFTEGNPHHLTVLGDEPVIYAVVTAGIKLMDGTELET